MPKLQAGFSTGAANPARDRLSGLLPRPQSGRIPPAIPVAACGGGLTKKFTAEGAEEDYYCNYKELCDLCVLGGEN
jgi:hypothetical protein